MQHTTDLGRARRVNQARWRMAGDLRPRKTAKGARGVERAPLRRPPVTATHDRDARVCLRVVRLCAYHPASSPVPSPGCPRLAGAARAAHVASARRRPAAAAVRRSASCHPRLLFFFNDAAPTEIYTLSLHDALPI